MNKPMLSIITINYNNKDGLDKTIKSVLDQRGLPAGSLEYIIVDGGSTDGSVDVIKKYLAGGYSHKISKWVSEKDSGIYNAFNKGIGMAEGDIISLLNSGDTVIDGAYDNILEIHKARPDSILYGVENFCRDGKFVGIFGPCADELPIRMIAHSASFVPRKIYEKYGLYDESFKSSGDWDLFLTFYQAGVSFYYINKIVVDFDACGISNSNLKLVEEENIRLLEKHGIKANKSNAFVKRVLHFLLPGFCFFIFRKLSKLIHS